MKYGKYKWKFIYAPKPSAGVTGSFITKLTLVQAFFKDNLCRISWEKDRLCSFVSNSRMNERTFNPHKTSRKPNNAILVSCIGITVLLPKLAQEKPLFTKSELYSYLFQQETAASEI